MCAYSNNSKSLILSVVILKRKRKWKNTQPANSLALHPSAFVWALFGGPFHVGFFFIREIPTQHIHTHTINTFSSINNITVPDCAFNVMHCAIIIQFHRLFLVEKRDSFSGYTHFITVYSSLKIQIVSRQFQRFIFVNKEINKSKTNT